MRDEKAGTEGKRGDYGFPYFGGGGFCSFEKAKVVKWLKVGRLCAAGAVHVESLSI